MGRALGACVVVSVVCRAEPTVAAVSDSALVYFEACLCVAAYAAAFVKNAYIL